MINYNEENFKQQYKKLKNTLCNAYKAPYYKKILDESKLQLDKDFGYDDFCRIAFTTKDNYDENKFNMLTKNIDGFNNKNYFKLKRGVDKQKYVNKYDMQFRVTSGSTGQPLEIFKSRNDDKKDYISLNLHRRKLTEYDFTGKFLWIWPVNPYTIKYYNYSYGINEPITVNKYGYQFFIYEYSDENLYKLYNCIVEQKCEWITSSPSALYNLAIYIKKNGLNKLDIKYIECHSEKLYPWQENEIIEFFGVKPVSIYSSNEVQFMGAFCENKQLHIFTNSCFIETINSSKGVDEICVTSLNYKDVPVIRYKLGDCGEWSDNQKCDCKLNKYPILKLKGHRMNDFVKTKMGTNVEPFVVADSIYFFSNRYGIEIKKYRVIQKEVDYFEYYFEDDIFDSGYEMELFFENYLFEVLGYEIKVAIKALKDDINSKVGMKYKYFECKVK